jgi:hypothetical protein
VRAIQDREKKKAVPDAVGVHLPLGEHQIVGHHEDHCDGGKKVSCQAAKEDIGEQY